MRFNIFLPDIKSMEQENDPVIKVQISTPTSTRAEPPRHIPYMVRYRPIVAPRDAIRILALLRDEDDDDLPRNADVTIDAQSHPYRESQEPKDCPICQVQLRSNDQVITLDCAHIYHVQCISEWVKYKDECPLCRTSIQVLET
jgi:hypothetical protein